VAADVVQWSLIRRCLWFLSCHCFGRCRPSSNGHSGWNLFSQTVKALLWSSLVQQKQQQDSVTDAPSTPVFLLGIVNRAQNTLDLLFRLADELGFVWQVIPHCANFCKMGIVPATCRESGGRITEVYELRLLLPNGSACGPHPNLLEAIVRASFPKCLPFGERCRPK
jgi:hypothetical protein